MNLLIIGIFILLYFGSSGGYYGFGRGWITDSYSRYFILPTLILSVGTSVLLNYLKNKITAILVVFVIIASIINSINLTFFSRRGLIETKNTKVYYKEIDKLVSTLPENSIIITNDYSKAIISRPVLTTYLIKNPSVDQTKQKILSYVQNLDSNNHIYLLENPSVESTFLNLNDYFSQDPRFNVHMIESEHNLTKIQLNKI